MRLRMDAWQPLLDLNRIDHGLLLPMIVAGEPPASLHGSNTHSHQVWPVTRAEVSSEHTTRLAVTVSRIGSFSLDPPDSAAQFSALASCSACC
jgi:hypothetical protein